jgi:hypothetical protein
MNEDQPNDIGSMEDLEESLRQLSEDTTSISDFEVDSTELTELDELLEGLNKNIPPLSSLTVDETDLEELISQLEVQNLDELFFSNNSVDLEDLLSEIQDPFSTEVDSFDSKQKSSKPKPKHKPDPNLKARDVANWMLEQVKLESRLYQSRAVSHIEEYFGDRFVRENRHGNPAISKDVLKQFLVISLKPVVWVHTDKYWRLRRPSDPPPPRRQVKS